MVGHSRTAGLRALLTAAIVALLLGNTIALGALGSDPSEPGAAPESPTSVASAPSQAAPDGTSSPSTTAAPRPAKGNNATKGQAPTTTTPTTLFPKTVGNYAYEVTMTPLCVMGGAPITVTMRLTPDDSGSMIAAYAGGGSHNTKYHAYAGPDGIITATLPTATIEGPAALLTQANDGPDRTGATVVYFRVGGPTDPC